MRRLPGGIPLVIIAAMLAVTACGKSERKPAATEAAPVVKGVAVAAVTSEIIPDLLEAVGTVRARNSAAVAARIPGTVAAVHVREGDRVKKGQLLVTLEAAESTAGAAGAKSAVVGAERDVDAAVARKKLAESTYDRYRNLLAEQAVTRQEFEGRQMERDVATQELARAEARLAQAREASRSAGTTAGYTRITSPLSGIVTAKGVDAGMTVFPGTPVLTVEGEGGYRLEVAAPEGIAGKVKPGDVVMVAMGEGATPSAGKVAEVVPVVDPVSRTFIVKVDIAATGARSGMYGRVSFPAGERKGILVPKGSLVERGALTHVWVVGNDNIARMRLVKTGRVVDEKVELLSGLSAGERIVTGGTEKLVDGARVK